MAGKFESSMTFVVFLTKNCIKFGIFSSHFTTLFIVEEIVYSVKKGRGYAGVARWSKAAARLLSSRFTCLLVFDE